MTMHSVFEALPLRPICIYRPNISKNLLISVTPLIRSSHELKMKAPSSRYKICKILKITSLAKPFYPCGPS